MTRLSTLARRFVPGFVVALLLAALCAWLFGITLAGTYPDGIIVYPPNESAPPPISDAFHIGMAIGWLFACLLLVIGALCVFTLNKLKASALGALPAPLAAAALCCVPLFFLALGLAD